MTKKEIEKFYETKINEYNEKAKVVSQKYTEKLATKEEEISKKGDIYYDFPQPLKDWVDAYDEAQLELFDKRYEFDGRIWDFYDKETDDYLGRDYEEYCNIINYAAQRFLDKNGYDEERCGDGWDVQMELLSKALPNCSYLNGDGETKYDCKLYWDFQNCFGLDEEALQLANEFNTFLNNFNQNIEKYGVRLIWNDEFYLQNLFEDIKWYDFSNYIKVQKMEQGDN